MIRLENIAKAYGAATLFDDVSYTVPTGSRVALVGANGAGKTTLLNIICGESETDGGCVVIPNQADLGYLPQKPNNKPLATVLSEAEAGAQRLARLKEQMEEALKTLENQSSDDAAVSAYDEAESAFRTAGGYALSAQAIAVLSGLGFSQDDMEKDPKVLSGGWRMRLELARLILRDPDIMVLDEPTNHLDLPSLAWFEAFLQRFRGTLLFVSHDRILLNKLSTITLHLHSRKVTPYVGNFDAFLEEREQRLAQAEAQREDLRKRREHMEKFVRRFGAKATKATQAQSRVKMIARLRDLEAGIESVDADTTLTINLPLPPKLPRVILEVENGAIGYEPGKSLASGMNLLVENGARVAVIGANGIGKSTFLKTLADQVPKLEGRFALGQGVSVSYFAQDQRDAFDLESEVLEILLQTSAMPEKAARSLLGGFLFSGDAVYKPAKVLSGGELSRLGLACALGRPAGLLLLDEPTNHLDMAAVEALAEGLASSQQTMLFVSHDRIFIDAVCTHIFAMLPDGRSMLFQGQLADYERLAVTSGFPNVLDPEALQDAGQQKSSGDTATTKTSGSKADHTAVKNLKREHLKLSNELKRAETDMDSKRDRIAIIEDDFANHKTKDHDTLQDLGQELQALRRDLEQKENLWLEAQTRIEEIEAELRSLGRL